MNTYKVTRLATQKYHNLIGNNLMINNSVLFTEAHKMTRLTIKPTETYRYKFGQWLIFLKTAMTNKLGITSINQSVWYVPVLSHDGISCNKPLKTSYIKNNTFLLCLLAMQLLFIVLIFTAKF